ncbi:hypothetical protein GTR04_3673 [Trichophyton interdigitale]|uniref:Uncharacterized protein n=1 Tax=Trichophyton interdigitale TaxID=101480 RepID=A0A9P4YFY6_9EURO|nr:hypothetical protein GY632_3082 [Trichophyton interdigitale]KAF3899142.1 hypothetical protein GY631_0717 [Trichophyton interdigitale]KAG8208937.1 hypothetical protein GTR04_3673 [Trichophyton interdigitale]
MTFRNLYLVTFHVPSDKWKHLAIFVFNTGDTKKGTLIHVIGNPPTGYTLQFQRNYDPTTNESFQKIILIGKIAANYVADPKSSKPSNDNVPRGQLEVIASRIPPPTVGNYMAPFKGVIRRCQEWTMDFVTELVIRGYLDGQACTILREHKDPTEYVYGAELHAVAKRVYGSLRKREEYSDGEAQAYSRGHQGRVF